MTRNNYWNLDFSEWTVRWDFTSLWKIRKRGTCYEIYCRCKCWYEQRCRRQELVKKTRCCFKCSSEKKKHIKHGKTDQKIYQIWHSIQSRIYNKNNSSYKHYWWRGIKCLWNSFEDFYKDMIDSYNEHVKVFWEWRLTTIDRIDVDWDYCKQNCRRATIWEQNANKQACWINRYWITEEDFAKKYWCTKWNIITRFKRCWHDFDKLVDFMEHKALKKYEWKTARQRSISLWYRPQYVSAYMARKKISLKEAIDLLKM